MAETSSMFPSHMLLHDPYHFTKHKHKHCERAFTLRYLITLWTTPIVRMPLNFNKPWAASLKYNFILIIGLYLLRLIWEQTVSFNLPNNKTKVSEVALLHYNPQLKETHTCLHMSKEEQVCCTWDMCTSQGRKKTPLIH